MIHSLLSEIVGLVFVPVILISPMSAVAFPSIRTLGGPQNYGLETSYYTSSFHGLFQPEHVLMHYQQKLLFVPNSCHADHRL